MSTPIATPPEPRVQPVVPAEQSEFPVILPGYTYDAVEKQIGGIVLERPITFGWAVGFIGTAILVVLLHLAVVWLLIRGVGIWGIDIPVAWGFAIINFVWWIGIGHAGTLISAILYLFRQRWRTSINRFAEAMTIFAVMCAGLFPLIHLGRPWMFYYLIPYPNTMEIWPQFRSPLIWDFFAVSTYFTTSVLFWYSGMVPDFAALRDRAKQRFAKVIFGILSFGWRGSARHWRNYEDAYVLLAALSTPLVVSVHSVVSFDFAVGIVPGWHSTIFPPYFVAGALYAGFAMVLTIAIILRPVFKIEGLVTMRHLDNMAKLMLASGLVVMYGYLMEGFMAWYGGREFETYQQLTRLFGTYGGWGWGLLLTNVLIPQLLWFKRFRTNIWWLLLISTSINIGMWIERFIIVVVSLHRDYMPSAWGYYSPTIWDIATYAGTLGFFTFALFLFVRLLPMIPAFEVKEMLSHLRHEEQTA
ncbi:MAG TPA: NrfD/PsrC family molybdoenzyme membrane anchor subunit [Chloroflexota bacterium]|jgi:Ni/Fe-hydrogenase subunit HybB-like protein|nr:NrfD/PsrC family molybdoenzyme membrane anchor subunit [Chloroflexota bacterium]